MAGNIFTTGGDVAAGVDAQPGYSQTYTSEQYSLGTVRIQPSDEVESGLTTSTPAGTGMTGEEKGKGNSGVDRDKNFALLTGDREWVFIKANGTKINKGDVVVQSSGLPFQGVPNTGASAQRITLLGVADNDIPSDSFGWVIRKGCAVGRTDAASGGKTVTINTPLVTDSVAGEVKDASGTLVATEVIGLSLEGDDTTLVDFIQAYIDIG